MEKEIGYHINLRRPNLKRFFCHVMPSLFKCRYTNVVTVRLSITTDIDHIIPAMKSLINRGVYK